MRKHSERKGGWERERVKGWLSEWVKERVGERLGEFSYEGGLKGDMVGRDEGWIVYA